MKKIIILSAAVLALASCGNRNQQKKAAKEAANTEQAAVAPDTHNSRNSLDYEGTYHGTIPCADCAGIQVNVTIDRNGNYTKTMAYMGKPDIFTSKGTYTWDTSGNKITLEGEPGPDIYKVGEGTLTMLNLEGNPITGDLADLYILKKQ